MTKFESIEILDIEESEDGNKLIVPFEVPGNKFGQSYPKRLSHTFPKKTQFLEVVDEETGERRFEKIVKKLYLEQDEDKKERQKVDKKLDEVKQECKGKCYSKNRQS